jgi:hypothetical protein
MIGRRRRVDPPSEEDATMADDTEYEAESDTESDTDDEAGAEGWGQQHRPYMEAMAYGDATPEMIQAHNAWRGQGYDDESSDEEAEAETEAETEEEPTE